MELKEIIQDIEDVNLTNNRTLDYILEVEHFLRESIRHNLSLKLFANDNFNGTSEKNPLKVTIYAKDVNSVFSDALIEEIWEMEGEGTIWFKVWFRSTSEIINFDDMPIELLIMVKSIRI